MRKLSKVILFSQLGNYFSPVREVISIPFWVAMHRYDISNRQEFDGRLPFLPHNSFQMRPGYMNLASLTCTPRTRKNHRNERFVHGFWCLWEYKWLIISLLEKKLSCLLFQFQLFQLIFWWLRFFIFSIFIILYIYYNYIYIK